MPPLQSQKVATIGVGTSQYPFQLPPCHLLTTNGNALSALGAYSHMVNKPVPDPTNGVYIFGPFDPTNAVELKFFGTDANNETGLARVWSIKEKTNPAIAGPVVEYIGTILLNLALTLGDASLNVNSKAIPGVTANYKAVDTITLTNDYTRGGATVYGDGADAWPSLFFDRVGAPFLVVELSIASSTAAGLGVIASEV